MQPISRLVLVAVLGTLIVGCGGSSSAGDSGGDGGAQDSGGDSMSVRDAVDDTMVADTPASVDGDTDASTCTPSDAGVVHANYYCDLGSIHVITHDGAASEVQAYARVGLAGAAGCGVIDSVDLLRGSSVVQRIDVATTFAPGDTVSHLATAAAATAWTTECANETTRLTDYGILVRGRDVDGPFEAHCGTADFGSRWPPGTYLACHHNVELPAVIGSPTMAMVMSFGVGTATNLNIAIQHTGPTPVFSSIGGTVRVVSPQYAPFRTGPPLASMDTSGWMGVASETMSPPRTYTSVSLNNTATPQPFPTTLCPVASTDPMSPPPPYFLARIAGASAAGPTTLEVLAGCVTVPSH